MLIVDGILWPLCGGVKAKGPRVASARGRREWNEMVRCQRVSVAPSNALREVYDLTDRLNLLGGQQGNFRNHIVWEIPRHEERSDFSQEGAIAGRQHPVDLAVGRRGGFLDGLQFLVSERP